MAKSNTKNLMNCRFRHPDATHRLFCFPWAGGGSNFYSAWGKDLAPNIEVFGVTLTARESRFREDPCSSVRDTVLEIANVIITEFGDKPFIFFGHSMGALLSYETAMFLRKEHGKQPEHMYLSGISAPHSESRKDSRSFEGVSDAEFLEHLRGLGGTPPEILNNHELMQIYLPSIKADYTMLSQIKGDPPTGPPALSCGFTFFDGTDDSEHVYDDWKRLTRGPFLLQKLPGDHFYLKNPINQKTIFEFIQNNFPMKK